MGCEGCLIYSLWADSCFCVCRPRRSLVRGLPCRVLPWVARVFAAAVSTRPVLIYVSFLFCVCLSCPGLLLWVLPRRVLPLGWLSVFSPLPSPPARSVLSSCLSPLPGEAKCSGPCVVVSAVALFAAACLAHLGEALPLLQQPGHVAGDLSCGISCCRPLLSQRAASRLQLGFLWSGARSSRGGATANCGTQATGSGRRQAAGSTEAAAGWAAAENCGGQGKEFGDSQTFEKALLLSPGLSSRRPRGRGRLDSTWKPGPWPPERTSSRRSR